MKNAILRATVFGIVLLPAAAFAQSDGMVTTDLNLREGPGSNYGVLTTIPDGDAVKIEGCVEGTNWCQVMYEGETGYAYAQYLASKADNGTTVVVAERRGIFPSIVGDSNTTAGVVGGAIAGALVGGPIGAAVGAAGGAVAANVSPTEDVIGYANNNPRETVYLDGEVVVGAGVPAEVELTNVPDSEYRYANINGETVLIDPDTRQIVYIVR